MRRKKRVLAAVTAMGCAVCMPLMAWAGGADAAVIAEEVQQGVTEEAQQVITEEVRQDGIRAEQEADMTMQDSLLLRDHGAVLYGGPGDGMIQVTDTIAVIGEMADDLQQSNIQARIQETEYPMRAFDASTGSGWIFEWNQFAGDFYGCTFMAPDYLGILSGGSTTFTASEKLRGYGASDGIGFLCYGDASTVTLRESDFEVADTLFTVMSEGTANLTLDNVQARIYGWHPWSGTLFQFMDPSPIWTEANDQEMDILDLTMEEYLANVPAAEGSASNVLILNSDLIGDIYNSTGSSNSAHVSDRYDGSTNVLSTWKTALVNVTLDHATLTGTVSTSYAQHVDEEGNPVEGLFFLSEFGANQEAAEESFFDFRMSHRVLNTPAYNGIGQINLILTGDSVWNVTGEGILNSLTIEEGSEVYGTVKENADGTITIAPAEEVLEPGLYGTFEEVTQIEE